MPGLAAYDATKAALEAFAEALAIEVAGFGLDVTLAEPGPVSSGVLDDMLSYRRPDDPYVALFAGGGGSMAMMISPEEVAETLADLGERPAVPLRVPVGDWPSVIAARNAASYTSPLSVPSSGNSRRRPGHREAAEMAGPGVPSYRPRPSPR
jgi:NAD(P)-dependent dehydrogenase (short-subunit alcohol dehydrogenase family)